MLTEIEPCPFCGGDAHPIQDGVLHLVMCDECGARSSELQSPSGDHDAAKRGAIAAWNRRIAAHSAGAQEPVAWAVYNGWRRIAFYISEEGARDHAKAAQRRHDLSGSLAAFRVVPLYTHPQPMPQTDAAREFRSISDWESHYFPQGLPDDLDDFIERIEKIRNKRRIERLARAKGE